MITKRKNKESKILKTIMVTCTAVVGYLVLLGISSGLLKVIGWPSDRSFDEQVIFYFNVSGENFPVDDKRFILEEKFYDSGNNTKIRFVDISDEKAEEIEHFLDLINPLWLDNVTMITFSPYQVRTDKEGANIERRGMSFKIDGTAFVTVSELWKERYYNGSVEDLTLSRAERLDQQVTMVTLCHELMHLQLGIARDADFEEDLVGTTDENLPCFDERYSPYIQNYFNREAIKNRWVY